MTAGKGVVHGEMFPLVNQDKPNFTKFFQIWINLPSKNKMVDPDFKMVSHTVSVASCSHLYAQSLKIMGEHDSSAIVLRIPRYYKSSMCTVT